MVHVSPEQAANFFYTVEVNLNHTTTMVEYVATAKAHAVEAKPKGRPNDKAQNSSSSQGVTKAAFTPSSPLKSEGPAPLKQAGATLSPQRF